MFASLEHLEREIELTNRRREKLACLVRALVCDEEVNERAYEARIAAVTASTSFESIVSAMEAAGMPFKFRVFDPTTKFSDELIRRNFGTLATGLFRTLCTIVPDPDSSDDPIEIDVLADEASSDFRSLSTNLGAWDAAEDVEVWSRAGMSRQVVSDCEAAVLPVATTPLSRRMLYVLAARLMELAQLTSPEWSDDPDETRYQRIKRALYEANKLDEPGLEQAGGNSNSS